MVDCEVRVKWQESVYGGKEAAVKCFVVLYFEDSEF
jgi:hypothetical protein